MSTEIATPELVSEKPNSSGHLATQDPGIGKFYGIDQSGSDVWFVCGGATE